DGEAKGSGRSIRGLHLRDALDLVSKRHPGLILRFGGHAAAAGLSIRIADIERFGEAFEQTVRNLLTVADLERVIETDGPLATADLNFQFAETLDGQVWGQGFAPPAFFDEFEVAEQRVVGGRHLKLKLRHGRQLLDAIRFGEDQPLPARIGSVYRVQVNEYNGNRTIQLVVEHWQPA
ncbi:MAG TPA: DHHA1 domain-containing protein, partial [Burkholderiales bacterium]|nr:DHHA1 domain-containing protein [Burkholderiales bacterium]